MYKYFTRPISRFYCVQVLYTTNQQVLLCTSTLHDQSASSIVYKYFARPISRFYCVQILYTTYQQVLLCTSALHDQSASSTLCKYFTRPISTFYCYKYITRQISRFYCVLVLNTTNQQTLVFTDSGYLMILCRRNTKPLKLD